MMLVVVLLAAWVVAAESACPSLTPVQDFDVAKFAGTWYAQKQLLGNVLTQGAGSCVQAQYTLDTDTGVVTVVNSMKNLLGLKQTIKGTAVLADSTTTVGRLNVTLNTLVGAQSATLDCLDTDYDNFVVLYSCQELLGLNLQSAWIMTRVQELVDEEKTKVEALITDSVSTINGQGGPALTDFYDIKQSGC